MGIISWSSGSMCFLCSEYFPLSEILIHHKCHRMNRLTFPTVFDMGRSASRMHRRIIRMKRRVRNILESHLPRITEKRLRSVQLKFSIKLKWMEMTKSCVFCYWNLRIQGSEIVSLMYPSLFLSEGIFKTKCQILGFGHWFIFNSF